MENLVYSLLLLCFFAVPKDIFSLFIGLELFMDKVILGRKDSPRPRNQNLGKEIQNLRQNAHFTAS